MPLTFNWQSCANKELAAKKTRKKKSCLRFNIYSKTHTNVCFAARSSSVAGFNPISKFVGHVQQSYGKIPTTFIGSGNCT